LSAASPILADALAPSELAVARPSPEAPAPPRWGALDLLRFTAVLLMIQGHTFTTLLSGEHDRERWHRHHDFVHGYTAPMFLFASGLAFGVTSFRSWDRQTRPGPALNKRLRRYVSLIVIGYLLHLPAFLPEDWRWVTEAGWNAFFQVDVLQHVGVSLALLQLGAVVLKRPERLAGLVAVLFVVVVLAAPILWALPVGDVLPPWLAGYVNGHTGSTFSLVPWAAFTWAGLLVAYAARHHARPSHTLLGAMALTTLAVLVIPIAINRTGWNPYGEHAFWRSSPYYFFFRLGNVMAVLTALMGIERMIDRRRWMERFAAVRASVGLAETMGQESLIVYVTHLIVLHGCVITPGLQTYWGRSLSFGEVVLVTLALVPAMAVLAVGNARLKRWQSARRRLASA
jgi:hypothetical protein